MTCFPQAVLGTTGAHDLPRYLFSERSATPDSATQCRRTCTATCCTSCRVPMRASLPIVWLRRAAPATHARQSDRARPSLARPQVHYLYYSYAGARIKTMATTAVVDLRVPGTMAWKG